MVNAGDPTGHGGEILASGGSTVDSVEFIPLSTGGTIRIGGRLLPGTVEMKQSGGVNAPEKRTEEGYDYTTRVNREARTATITGWMNESELNNMRDLRNEQDPFAVAAGSIIMVRAVLDDLTETFSGEHKSGAVKVEVKIREAFQAQSGTSTVTATPEGGDGGLLGHGGFLGSGYALNFNNTNKGKGNAN